MLSHFDAIVEAAERDRQTNGFGRPSSIALSIAALCRMPTRGKKNRKRTYNIENSFCSENIKHQYT